MTNATTDPVSDPQASVIAITSLVSGSQVGGGVTTSVLNAHSIRTQLVPTVILGRHPGLGAPGGGGVNADLLASALDGMDANHRFERADAIFTGYFQTADQVRVAAQAISKARAQRGDLCVVVDPILGDSGATPDSGRLYIHEDTAKAIRDELIPLADVITPNRFELSWLSGETITTEADAVRAARALGPLCLLTSAPASAEDVAVMVIASDDAHIATAPHLSSVPNGTGDVFVAATLAAFISGQDWREAAGVGLARVSHILTETLKAGASDVLLTLDTLTADLPHPVWRRVGAHRPAWVMGLDGCKAGWAAVMIDLNGLRPPQQSLFANIQQALDWSEEGHQAQVLAIDMPIGFEDRPAAAGGRACERRARQILKHRSSSVFSSPLRPALSADTYDQAQARNRAAGGPGLSKQAYNLFPKLREVDAVMTAALSDSVVFETHPETSFAVMTGAPAAHKKSTHQGRAERLVLLKAQGLPESVFEPHPYKVSQCAPDDLVDAGLCALSAVRIAEGRALTLPENPPRDGKGLRMAIQA